MIKHMVVIIVLLNLVGCKLFQYNSDPKVIANGITIAKPATHSNLAYIWLPTANTGNKALYREAFDNNVINFSKKYNLTNLNPKVQPMFDNFIIEQGGAFNTKTGKLESERVQAAIQFTFNSVKQTYPNIGNLLVIHPKENSIKIVDGTATWNGVEQHVLTRSRDSVEFRPAISIALQYYNDVEKNNFHEVGLDLHAPDLTDNDKYEQILKHILTPIVLLNTKVK